MCLLAIYAPSLKKCLFRSSAYIFYIGYMNYLYILDVNSLSVISFANIFSYSIGFLFILSMVLYAVQKLLSLIWSHLFIFGFVSFALKESEVAESCLTLCDPMDYSLPGSFLRRIFQAGVLVAAAKSLQLSPTLCDPIDSSPPGSPVPGILQARTLEWIAISFSSA